MGDPSMASVKLGHYRRDQSPPIPLDHRGRCCVCGQGFGNLTSVDLGNGRSAHLSDYRMAPASDGSGGGKRKSRRAHERTHHRT